MPYSFRDLRIWQEARVLMIEVYKISKGFPKDELFGLTNQIRRSSLSIMANIAEGYGSGTRKERARFLTIARGSLDETRSHLSAAQALGFIDEPSYEKLDQRFDILCRSINSFMTSIRQQS